MKPIIQTFRQMLTYGVWPLLKERGFKRKGYDFERVSELCIENVRFGLAVKTDETGIFLFSVGVLYPKLERLLDFGREDPERQHTTAGIVVSLLAPPYKYKWWSIAAGENITEMGQKISYELEMYGLPLVENLNTLPKLIEQLETNKRLPIDPTRKVEKLAVAYYLQGDLTKALELLEAAIKEYARKPIRINFIQLRDYLVTEPKV